VLLASADHDFSRLSTGARTDEQLGAAFTFLLTWDSVPSIYYGDEIGMRYIPDLPNIEGSVIFEGYYNRAGCRTPMQWDESANAGFSTALASELYLPIDADPNRPTVSAQLDDPTSTLQLVRELIGWRRAVPALGSRASNRVINSTYPFAYIRGESHLVVVNPRREVAWFDIGELEIEGTLLNNGADVVDGVVTVGGFGYAILELRD
jgi:maltose alpha-D-glucosyltransferase/alpha-amylase